MEEGIILSLGISAQEFRSGTEKKTHTHTQHTEEEEDNDEEGKKEGAWKKE